MGLSPIIFDGMTWSYSRVKCFSDCPYRWYLKYIAEVESTPMFYSSYGSFMHELLRQYYSGEITKNEMKLKYLFGFRENVRGDRPTADTVSKYIEQGLQFIEQIKPLPFQLLDTERRFELELDGIRTVGFIDLVGEHDGDFVIVDHKSREMKPRSTRKKPTAKDVELDDMLRQLYLYAGAVRELYGKFPKSLYFNCFRNGAFIEEPFRVDRYHEVLDWMHRNIRDIQTEDKFPPTIDYFSCRWICDVKDECCYCEG